MAAYFTRREFLATAAAISAARNGYAAAGPRIHSFWLFKLLTPACVNITAAPNTRLHCTTPEREWIVEDRQFLCATNDGPPIHIAGPAGDPVRCVLEVPNRLRRSYFGVIEIRSGPDFVIPIISIDTEIATSSIVGAELPVFAAPPDALAAQAVVSRSILVATTAPRHPYADFCDTTHCQFLRSPALPGSLVARAVGETCGIVLMADEKIVAPRYSAACGGRTEGGINAGVQYTSVPCEICRTRKITRRGHGWGLCQEGALGLAQLGFAWRAILAKYYPAVIPVSDSYSTL